MQSGVSLLEAPRASDGVLRHGPQQASMQEQDMKTDLQLKKDVSDEL
jgi:hypothetical protein